jgi:hypothetical protein
MSKGAVPKDTPEEREQEYALRINERNKYYVFR